MTAFTRLALTVTCQSGGVNEVGSVEVQLTAPLTNGLGVVELQRPIRAPIVAGVATFPSLACTDDPFVSPIGVTYRVVKFIASGDRDLGFFNLPAASAPGPIDLAALTAGPFANITQPATVTTASVTELAPSGTTVQSSELGLAISLPNFIIPPGALTTIPGLVVPVVVPTGGRSILIHGELPYVTLLTGAANGFATGIAGGVIAIYLFEDGTLIGATSRTLPASGIGPLSVYVPKAASAGPHTYTAQAYVSAGSTATSSGIAAFGIPMLKVTV